MYVLLDNDYLIRVYQSFVAIFKNISYHAGIMLNAFSHLLCSKLYWYNRLVPNQCLLQQVCHHHIYVYYESTELCVYIKDPWHPPNQHYSSMPHIL